MEPAPDIRVSDRDRAHAMDRLGAYFADGYLDMPEFEERTSAAMVATYRSDLARLFADLPEESEQLPVDRTFTGAGAPPGAMELEDYEAQLELERTMDNARMVTAIDSIVAIGATTFFLGSLFIYNIPYAWLAFFLIPIASGIARMVFRVNDEDEELYNELKGDLAETRKARLRQAAKRRKELGG